MTPSGIKPAAFRFVAQYLNYCTTAVPTDYVSLQIIYYLDFTALCSARIAKVDNLETIYKKAILV